jgi:transcriptional regulator with XRE-family HTH domain
MDMQRLREERLRRNLTQLQVAVRVGLHPSTLAHLDCGKAYAWPKWRKSLERFYGVPADDLFAEAKEADDD